MPIMPMQIPCGLREMARSKTNINWTGKGNCSSSRTMSTLHLGMLCCDMGRALIEEGKLTKLGPMGMGDWLEWPLSMLSRFWRRASVYASLFLGYTDCAMVAVNVCVGIGRPNMKPYCISLPTQLSQFSNVLKISTAFMSGDRSCHAHRTVWVGVQ